MSDPLNTLEIRVLRSLLQPLRERRGGHPRHPERVRLHEIAGPANVALSARGGAGAAAHGKTTPGENEVRS